VSIRFTVEDHVARVTIDRPDRMNAIDEASEAELMRIWATIEKDDAVRCVVLTGVGDRAFCTGADMKQSGNKTGLEYWAAARPGGFGGLALRETLDVPVIGRVNGHALGGGMEMVLGCDIVVAAEKATWNNVAPSGHHHGIAFCEAFHTLIAHVIEISVPKSGTIILTSDNVYFSENVTKNLLPDISLAYFPTGILNAYEYIRVLQAREGASFMTAHDLDGPAAKARTTKTPQMFE